MNRSVFRRSPYRSRHGMLLGVCRGLAEHFGVSVKWTRIATLVAVLLTGFWPGLAIYLVAAWLMPLEPLLPMTAEGEEEFYQSYASSRSLAIGRIRRKYDSLNRRIARMENAVTDREFHWQQRLDGNRP
ncbi:MAG: PspC domain-containing protein [Deltaproteobacteria bacterium]|nr:PspC domain-containing protein [Deltaproteobacteria bacterium]